MKGWVGPHRYFFRFKIRALAHSLTVADVHRSAVIDGDTYFTRSPAALFARIGPGRSVMHCREGRPAPPEVTAIRHVLERHDPTDTRGQPWGIRSDQILWNAGVVGLHESDGPLCEEAVRLNDDLLEHGFGVHSHIAEMMAFSVCLTRRTTIHESHDVLAHYWQPELSDAFLPHLQAAWADPSRTPQQHFEQLWPRRPRPGVVRRAKTLTKRALWRAGLQVGRPGG